MIDSYLSVTVTGGTKQAGAKHTTPSYSKHPAAAGASVWLCSCLLCEAGTPPLCVCHEEWGRRKEGEQATPTWRQLAGAVVEGLSLHA